MKDRVGRVVRGVALVVGVAWAVGVARPARAAEDAPSATRRFVLIVASNHGGADREALRYAHTDASSFATVMTDLGGVHPADVRTLLEPAPGALEAALAALAQSVKLARDLGARTDLVVYYSGHSDDGGLLLGDERMPYPALRAGVEAVPADVRVIVLDSCASGAMLRDKGGRRVAPFLIDEATHVTGTAVLMSAAADEAAQESDRIRGSFFTHALLTGLRGAADAEGDGTVSLTEAYRFAFAETLARTERAERAERGAQHPAWDVRLSGTGDLVLTDLRDASAQLELAGDITGRVTVRTPSGALVAELSKVGSTPMRLSLPPGSYDVGVKSVGASAVTVEVVRGPITVVRRADLARVAVEPTVARGAAHGTADVAAYEPVSDAAPSALLIAGAGAAVLGGLALVGFGGTALYLTAVASDPAGDPSTKEVAITAGPMVVIGTGLGAAFGIAGAIAILAGSSE